MGWSGPEEKSQSRRKRAKVNVNPVVEREPLLTLNEAAAYLRVSHRTIRMWMRQGKLTSRRVGKLHRFTASQLDAFMEAESAARQPAAV